MRKRLFARQRQLPDRMVAADPFRMQPDRILSHYQRLQFRTDRHTGSLFLRLRSHSLLSESSLPNKKYFASCCFLDIGGFTIEIRSELASASLNCKRFQPFQTSLKKKKIGVYFHFPGIEDLIAPPLDPDNDPLLKKAGRRGTESPLLRSRLVNACLNRAREHTERLFIEIFPEALSILDFKNSCADFFYPSGPVPGFGKRLIGPALLAPFLPKFDACLLHASAIMRHGKAAVFLAPGEGGKTTAVRLSPSGAILGDDQVLVRRDKKGFLVSGTPWGLHVNATLQAPLAGLFLLQKADRFTLVPCPTREMITHIWNETKNPLSILPAPLKKRAFAIICAIAASVPAYTLSFAKGHIDWEAIDRVLVSGKTSGKVKRTTDKRRASS